MGLYETLHFTAKALVQITTQGARGDPGVVKTLGTTVGLLPSGLVADPGPSRYKGPGHGTGRLPPPTEAQEADTREAHGPEKGRRKLLGSDLAEAVVQHLQGPSPGWDSADPTCRRAAGAHRSQAAHAHNNIRVQATPDCLPGH